MNAERIESIANEMIRKGYIHPKHKDQVAHLLRRETSEQQRPRVPWCGRCECYHYYGNCV